ncbi:unnamed protein product [Schistocephalus solidus]|uniref:PEHE domain-containing protein n=1 Tax=Schistocephalus solidus TaxID=70667 RepID=A0A183SDX7_SCHSO|nr:unnamed protein product [Schistocephalus solidus]
MDQGCSCAASSCQPLVGSNSGLTFDPVNIKKYGKRFSATRSDLIAKKVAGIFPKRSIWRSLGLDYSNSPSENGIVKTIKFSCRLGGSLSCLARAARELPQLVKRACSPSSYLATSSQLSSPAPEPPKRPASASSRIRLSAPGRLSPPPTALHTNAPPGPPADRSAIRHAVSRLADITPVLERYGQLSNSASPSKITFLSQPLSLLSTQSPASATENRAPSPLFRRSLSPNSRLHGQSAEMASVKRLRRESLSSTRQRDASTSPLPPSAPLFSRPFLTTSSYYYQPEFDSLDWSTSTCLSADASSSESIETQRSATLPTRHLRRNTTKVTRHPRNQHHHDRSKGTQLHADSGGNAADNAESEEDTDDAAYQLRHSKLEIEEIKRERVSHQRMVEEELRSRLERRDLESWGRRQVIRTDPLADLNPEKYMPTQLDYPLSRILGRARRQHQDWFDDNDADISNCLAEKNGLHKACMDLRTDATKSAFFRCRRLLQQRLWEMQDDWMIRKAEEIQGNHLDVYKHGGPRLMAELTTLFQEMWRQGQVPQDFKDATIVHLYKRKGNRQICFNVPFADDLAINTVTEEDMQRSMDLFAAGCANFGLTISTAKAVVMHQPPPSTEYIAP